MNEGFLNNLGNALYLIFTGNSEIINIVFLSLFVSMVAVVSAAIFSIPLGTYLGLKDNRILRYISKIIYTLMGLPPVVAGLVIFLLLSNSGPLGVLDLLWTPWAMIIAQIILAIPIITGLTMTAIKSKDKVFGQTAKTLGANKYQVAWAVIKEARTSIVSAVVAGLGRVIAEVGAVMMVGGNIQGKTRVMTTAIVLETRKGNFAMALALGIVLLVIAFIINSVLLNIQGGGKDSD